MLSISTSNFWKNMYPGASIGILEISKVNILPATFPWLEKQKDEVEKRLRKQYNGFSRQDFLALPVMSCYDRYYKKFAKTYHVLQQVESIALKGKNLPSISPLVDSNFVAEVDTFILTAGHDADKLQGPVTMDVGQIGDQMVQMNGITKTIIPNDMIMRDSQGVCCSIIYGQDNLSPISAETTHVLYVAYAPIGIPVDLVKTQLDKISENIMSFSFSAKVEQKQVLIA